MDSQYDESVPLSSDLQCGADDLPIARRFADKVIRRQHGHERFAAVIFPQQMNGGQANGRGRIAAKRLNQHVPRRHLPQLTTHGACLLAIGDGPNMRRGKERDQAVERLLEHRLLTDDVEQLFRGAHAAAGPKTRSTSTRKNDGVSGWSYGIHWRRIAER